jgi:hypothetical protein
VVRVDREQQVVTGSLTVAPDNDSARFDASREFAFGASVDVVVTYDEQSLGKFRFQVRPLPTLANGAVFGASGDPLSGVQVELVELGRSAETDDGGSFSFGFGEPAERDLPAGTYTLRVNAQGKLFGYGAAERKVRFEAQRFNSLGMTRLPNLGQSVPARLVESGAQTVLFDNGKLTLDLSDASVRMPDGAQAGAVHIEPYLLRDLAIQSVPYATPEWVYAAYPVGVAVSGNLRVSIALPTVDGSYAYLDGGQSRVLLLGRDAQTLELVPVGVGLIDKAARTLRSEGLTHFARLDIIGYAPIGTTAQAQLERYGRGEIDLSQLVRAISTVSP